MLFSEPKIPQSDCERRFVNGRRGFSALQRAENSSMVRWSRWEGECDYVSVLFSEPKIPQFGGVMTFQTYTPCFSALQRAENSSIRPRSKQIRLLRMFQCSSASRKFLNTTAVAATCAASGVSVLFSEPKIPQFYDQPERYATITSFSALQRAENSSILRDEFRRLTVRRFSALQRAENSSMGFWLFGIARNGVFQCSSASRKFLNSVPKRLAASRRPRFSALQRAENSSINSRYELMTRTGESFSALQRAENSSMVARLVRKAIGDRFSALQRAENSSMLRLRATPAPTRIVSVLFSEPKIPQCAA